mmetsp:Transcript_16243/g.40414  ORF Transcript_16243/g.40414 Transcript_16243/m.40414 type:complete len:422 (-) Transcript_16243:1050-2315(-)|eukprot:CAMPEP_0202861934 /NCGR_PEP_ID=MMETSP1391-20130828/3157_1 /ASSEMBLY_ACC=CAM_ASM_000867 /TAXON_ID=1034604 /ORGANISM="Chlamydomonas leiostraca, Strain SAG 11-49" /LENGTH=421 /DNA_ID=CAMNT_0049541395 /DNA_START=75 /DNA_END=1340 /DNA_ORIENTATION=+
MADGDAEEQSNTQAHTEDPQNSDSSDSDGVDDVLEGSKDTDSDSDDDAKDVAEEMAAEDLKRMVSSKKESATRFKGPAPEESREFKRLLGRHRDVGVSKRKCSKAFSKSRTSLLVKSVKIARKFGTNMVCFGVSAANRALGVVAGGGMFAVTARNPALHECLARLLERLCSSDAEQADAAAIRIINAVVGKCSARTPHAVVQHLYHSGCITKKQKKECLQAITRDMDGDLQAEYQELLQGVKRVHVRTPKPTRTRSAAESGDGAAAQPGSRISSGEQAAAVPEAPSTTQVQQAAPEPSAVRTPSRAGPAQAAATPTTQQRKQQPETVGATQQGGAQQGGAQQQPVPRSPATTTTTLAQQGRDPANTVGTPTQAVAVQPAVVAMVRQLVHQLKGMHPMARDQAIKAMPQNLQVVVRRAMGMP